MTNKATMFGAAAAVPPPPPPPVAPPPPPPPPRPYPPGEWGPPRVPHDPPDAKRVPGTNEAGVPNAWRGRISLDTASYLATEGRNRGASANWVAILPLTDHTLFEAIAPLSSFAAPFGNPHFGVNHVIDVSDGLWIIAGGNFGVPLLDDDDFMVQSIPRAYWNANHFAHDVFPMQFRFGLDYHVSIVELRAHLEPSVWFPIHDKDEIDGAFFHSFEAQFGHEIGGGLRLQGVVVGPGSDNYQFAISPFFVVTRDLGFVRVGLMLPVDEELGPALERSWGMLINAGIHID